jgi:hypothetical protein
MSRVVSVAARLTLAGCLVAPLSEARAQEVFRSDLFVGLGTASVETLTLPVLFVAENELPGDGLVLFEPSLVVSPIDRLQIGASLTAAVAFNPAASLVGRRYASAGIGDARFFVGAVLAPERGFLPSVQLTAFGSAKTATLPHLAGPQIMGGRVLLYKIVHPRFRVGGSVSISDNLREQAARTLEPLQMGHVLIELGVSRAWMLSTELHRVTGGARIVDGRRLEGLRDLQTTMTLTKWMEGRPRYSLVVSALGLERDDPFLLIGVRFAIASVARKPF